MVASDTDDGHALAKALVGGTRYEPGEHEKLHGAQQGKE